MIRLGDEVIDQVSKFKGIAVSRHSYLQGCDRICVQSPVNEKGELPNTATFDEPMLSVVRHQMVGRIEEAPNGGPERYAPTEKGTGQNKS